ncbi:hypothetical protein ACOXU5_02145 [Vagococcus fluvialis]|uniref:hypothetical protein n=1 Tax=Vagococcus fluvialis TaxID=2738 RepID=UPI003BF10997
MTNNLENQFQMQQSNQNGVMAQTAVSREMEEVKGQIFMAKQFPRNTFEAQNRILDACKRESLASTAIYSFPRGNQNVQGPSIRLAEVLAQNWGNISFGIKELEQKNGESIAMAYAWDVETNTRQEKIFTVPHKRYTRSKGITPLTDPRDIYELVANNGSRRLRACILGVIPGDIVELAVEECNKTLSGNNSTPLKDRLARALTAFKENYDVTQEMIEDKFGYDISQFSEKNFVELIQIFNAIKDGMTKVTDVFEKVKTETKANSLEKEFKDKENKDKKEVTENEVEQGELLQSEVK